MRVVRKHLGRDMARNGHDGLFAGLRLCQFRNCVMTQIAEAQPDQRALEFVDIGGALIVAAFVSGVL